MTTGQPLVNPFRRWWRSDKLLTPRMAWANIGIGAACVVCVLFDWRLGLGTVGRWYLGFFALLCLPWGFAALRVGADPVRARSLRLAGDIAAWTGMVGFTLVAWFALDRAEWPPFWTLAAVALATVIGAIRAPRAAARSA